MRTLVHRLTHILLRLLALRPIASLLLLGTLGLAGIASGPLSTAQSSHADACADQNVAWSTYTPATDYAYCPQNAPAQAP